MKFYHIIDFRKWAHKESLINHQTSGIALVLYKKMKKYGIFFHVAAAVFLSMFVFSTQFCSAQESKASESSPGRLIHKAASSRADDPFDGISFPTFYKSGFDVCTNSDGKPVILLFSSSSCSHCEWLGEIFDTIVPLYAEAGLIEAHHFDRPTGDDLLTEEVETGIPEEFIAIFDRGNPKGVVPYSNFSCKYERVGNGYEKTQDAEAEGREIMDVIETLIRVISGAGGE